MDRALFRALVRARLKNKSKPPRLPRAPMNDAVRRRYASQLLAMLREAQAMVRRRVLPIIEKQAFLAGIRRDASDEIGDVLDEVAAEFAKKWTRKKFESLVEPVPSTIAKSTKAAFNRQARSVLGADVLGSEPWLQAELDRFTTSNVALIKSIPQTYFARIETSVKEAIAQGGRWETIADEIAQAAKVSESKAKLIARDQVGKFHGYLAQERQGRLGITRYIWRTLNDERVRDDHKELDGDSRSWDQSPIPGEEIQCRCYAEPDLASALGDAGFESEPYDANG